jgi:NADPH2:quinone reductase
VKAWVVRGKGQPHEVFEREDFPEPTHEAMSRYGLDIEGLRPLREGEEPVREYAFMRVSCAGLAKPDVTMATGEYPVPILRPYISGQEAVGIVEEATPGLQHFVGKRVVAFTPQPYGSFAERCVVMPPMMYEAPESFSDEEAAAFLIPSHTAHHVVVRRGKVTAGETVLILGAAGGVPSSAVQICLAEGARVVAIAGGAEKVEFVRGLGAQVVIDHQAEDFVEAVIREVGPNAIDAIIDFVQGEAGQRSRPLLRVEGRHVMAGHAGGLIPVHPNEFYLQNWTLIGCCVGSGYSPEQLPENEDEAHAYVLDLIERGLYRTPVSKVVSFEQIPETLRDIAERRVMGRIVAHIGS